MATQEIKSDARMSQFGNDMSDAIHKALSAGLSVDETCIVGAKVLADYWRITYGPRNLSKLASIIVLAAETPLPGQQ